MDNNFKQAELDPLDRSVASFRIARVIDLATRVLLGLLLATIVLCVGTNVAGRFLVGTTFPWMTELSRLLFIWLAFIGAVSADLYGEHVAIRMVSDRARGLLSIALGVLRGFLPLTLYGVLLFAAWERVAGSARFSPLLGIPMQWISISILIAAVLLGVIGCLRLIHFRVAFLESETPV